MSIQSNINQMISLAGLLASQSPALRAKSEQRAAMRNLAKQEDIVKKQIDIAQPGDKERYGEELLNIKEKQFETMPTEETYSELIKMRPGQSTTIEESPEDIAQEQIDIETKQKAVQEYKDSFKKADNELAEEQKIRRETRKRILEGTPSAYIMRGDEWQQ